MDFLTQLFSALNTRDSWLVILWLFLSFLIGFLTAWFLYKRKLADLQLELDRRIAEYNSLKAKYDAKLEELSLRDADLRKAQLEIEELYAKNKQLSTEKGQLHSDLFAAKEEIEKLKAQLAIYHDKNEKNKVEVEALNNQILGLQTRTRDLETKSAYGATLTTDLNALKDENNKLKTDWSSLQNSNAKLQNDLTSLKVSLDACRNQSADLKASNEALLAEIERLKAQKPSAPITGTEKASQAKEQLKAAFGGKLKSATEAEKDDLKLINGVGPFIEKKLNNLSIYTFEQVSQFDADLSEKVTDAIEFFPGRIERDNWAGQAALLHQKKLAGTLETGVKNPSNPEDLKVVEGIGPKIEQLLKTGGINTWSQLANAPVARLQEILDAAGDHYRIHNPETWPKQAAMLAAGEWDKFREFTDYLIAGRDKGKES